MADLILTTFDGVPEIPRDYVARATARPALVRAHAGQMAQCAAAD